MTPIAKLLGVIALLSAGLDFNFADEKTGAPLEQNYGTTCLALVGFSEARDQSDAGLAAVMQVVLNRATDPARRWPATLCDAALQPGQFLGVDRWPVPRHPERIDAKSWARAQAMAQRVIDGTAPVPFLCLFATGFDQDAPRPNHGVVCRVGAHTFYTEPQTRHEIAGN
jgi:spore germination cell wall hydrolase CwlJ-like protein